MAEKINSQFVKAKQKQKELLTKIEKIKAKKEQLGSEVENEAELKRLQQLENNYKTDLEKTKKEAAALEKQVKDKEKKQTRVDQLSKSLAAEEEKQKRRGRKTQHQKKPG